jgi:hypothetical protein
VTGLEAVLAALRAEHRGSVAWMAGGHGWACSCGREGRPGIGYPTAKQAEARLDRHLSAERRKIAARLAAGASS